MPRLPPLDDYRRPFVVPIGHMAMQAARVDNLLIELIATVPRPPNPQPGIAEVGARLRNWGPDQAHYVEETLALVEVDAVRDQALLLVDRFTALRDLRHRAVHDAIEVGISPTEDGKWQGRAISVGYLRPKHGQPRQAISQVSVELIGHLAMQLYALGQEIEGVLYALRVDRQNVS